tara:strand:- start:365 stop:817 length:453 start_codon:yes stop_codon:yes gene_type:complete
MLENCTGLNLLNHLKQKNVKIDIDFQQIEDKYNTNFDIPELLLDSENGAPLLKKFNDKKLITLIKRRNKFDDSNSHDNILKRNKLEKEISSLKNENKTNLHIIRKNNINFSKWVCIIKFEKHIFYDVSNTKKQCLLNIFNDNRNIILTYL